MDLAETGQSNEKATSREALLQAHSFKVIQSQLPSALEEDVVTTCLEVPEIIFYVVSSTLRLCTTLMLDLQVCWRDKSSWKPQVLPNTCFGCRVSTNILS